MLAIRRWDSLSAPQKHRYAMVSANVAVSVIGLAVAIRCKKTHPTTSAFASGVSIVAAISALERAL